MPSTFQWRQVLRVAAALTSVTLFFFGAPIAVRSYRAYAEARLDPIAASQSEQEAILRVVIDASRFESVPPPPSAPGQKTKIQPRQPVVLIDDSTVLCDESEHNADKQDCDLHSDWEELVTSPYIDRRIPKKLRLELIAVNQSRTAIPKFTSPLVQYSTRKQIYEVFQNQGWWKDVYTRYPDTTGFAEASRAALTADHMHALVYLSYSCGGSCGTGFLYFLGRSGDQWKIEVSSLVWVS